MDPGQGIQMCDGRGSCEGALKVGSGVLTFSSHAGGYRTENTEESNDADHKHFGTVSFTQSKKQEIQFQAVNLKICVQSKSSPRSPNVMGRV